MASTVFRLEAHFTGRVQGVGFRYLTRQIATGYEVTGQVRNLPDGRVHMVAEGREPEVRDFVREIKTQMSHFIKEASEEVLSGPAHFRDFQIG